jgi:hypothetical protein
MASQDRTKLLKGIVISSLFVALVGYLVYSADESSSPLLNQILGYANIAFFGTLMAWGIFRWVQSKTKK